MSDHKIKHFVIIRFFPRKHPNYPLDIFDVNFLSKQLLLAQNALASLENQKNKNFELVFLANEKFFDNEKYEFVFSMLRASTVLPIKFVKTVDTPGIFAKSELSTMLKAAFDEYDYVIQTRLDFDDFVYKNAVADTQDKVSECDNVLAYGYCNGYRYVDGELYRYYSTFNGNGCKSAFMSLILKSSFAKKLPFLSVYSFGHDNFKADLKKFLEKQGVEFSDKMFMQNTSASAFIYYRHDLSLYSWRTKGNGKIDIPKSAPFTNATITQKKLKKEFGFFRELQSIE